MPATKQETGYGKEGKKQRNSKKKKLKVELSWNNLRKMLKESTFRIVYECIL